MGLQARLWWWPLWTAHGQIPKAPFSVCRQCVRNFRLLCELEKSCTPGLDQCSTEQVTGKQEKNVSTRPSTADVVLYLSDRISRGIRATFFHAEVPCCLKSWWVAQT